MVDTWLKLKYKLKGLSRYSALSGEDSMLKALNNCNYHECQYKLTSNIAVVKMHNVYKVTVDDMQF